MNYFASQITYDMGEIFNQVAEFARGRDTTKAGRVEGIQSGSRFFGQGFALGDAFTKKADKGAVNDVAGSAKIGVSADAHIGAFGPNLAALFISGIGFGFEIAHLVNGNLYGGFTA
ncbi:hypothetical protein SDC9_191698 [bioreactor metagenome]|uniref:Uncharacterized protein n=1 Tax=bioreactor metagenome TaxID=1076179 RepID=A0A645HYN4_9ZZZZ